MIISGMNELISKPFILQKRKPLLVHCTLPASGVLVTCCWDNSMLDPLISTTCYGNNATLCLLPGDTALYLTGLDIPLTCIVGRVFNHSMFSAYPIAQGKVNLQDVASIQVYLTIWQFQSYCWPQMCP